MLVVQQEVPMEPDQTFVLCFLCRHAMMHAIKSEGLCESPVSTDRIAVIRY